jgi:hypothetical protein
MEAGAVGGEKKAHKPPESSRLCKKELAGVTGLEPATFGAVFAQNAEKHTSKSHQSPHKKGTSRPDLQPVIDSWPTLSPEIRAAVLAIIKSAKVNTRA